MTRAFTRHRTLIAAFALAALAAMPAVSQVSAQTGQPASSPPAAACPLSPGGPPPSSLPNPTQLPQKLASALNLPLATVQQALTTLGSQSNQLLPPPQDPIAGAASQLGVSEQQLVAAVQSADQSVGGPMLSTTGGPNQGNVVFGTTGGPGGAGAGPVLIGGPGDDSDGGGQVMIASACADGGAATRPDPAAFFADVAQQLGSNFTAAQVQSAFQASAPTPPDPATMKSMLQQQTSSLAAALGVSAQALTSALTSAGFPSGCLPLFGEHLKPQSLPPGADNGKPIFIPLGGGPGGPGGPGVVAFSGGQVSGSGSVSVPDGGPDMGVAVACSIGPGAPGQPAGQQP
jgi:hypothetical protein